MAEPDFEAQLSRLYAEAPSFPDAALFNAEAVSYTHLTLPTTPYV